MPHLNCCSPWKLWLTLCRFYNSSIQRFFAGLGERVAKHPLTTTFFCFLIMGSLASGFIFLKTENRTEKLYIPQNSESISNLEKARNYGFYRPSRQTEVIILNNAGRNVLTKECLGDALSLHKLITNIAGYTKLCLPIGDKPAILSTDCVTKGPLTIFNYSINNMEDLLFQLNEPQISKSLSFEGMFGKISRKASGQVISAEAIRLVYYLKGFNLEEDVSKLTTEWEKEFLIRMKSLHSSQLKCGPIFYTTGRSLDDSISESTGSDIKLISITFTIMISFACFMLGKYRNPLTGHGLLAMAGVLSVGYGIMTAFGLAVLLRTPFISIVGVLPFLIVGVGIDDMFIIVDELDRTHPDETIPTRLRIVMKRVGPAITMTTLTDLLAFAIGTTSKFPSIVYFCTYAAAAISFSFLFLVTIFIAFMTYDCKRMNAGRRDMLPCLKAPTPSPGSPPWDEPQPQTSNKVMEWWGRLLMKPITKVVVVVVSVSLLSGGIYGTTFINEEFHRRDLAKDGSEFVTFLNTFEEYFKEDIQVDLVLETGVNYSDPSIENNIDKLSQIIKDNSYLRPSVISWFDEFRKWYSNKNTSAYSRNFMTSLKQFLRSHSRFASDVLLSKDNLTIEASRLYCFVKQSSSSVTLRDAMTTLREDLSKKSSLPVFASSYSFIFFEQYLSTLPETIRNLALASAAILIITATFLVNPIVVLLVFFGFVSLIFELLGLMYVWGVSLNSISMINLVMAIGFAVDYSAHVAHAFVFCHSTSPEEKVIHALRTVGASVLMGGVSTFLGMVVTAFASSEIFRIFFKMFFGIVVLGLLHGLCFLPVWMSLICRHHIHVDLQNNDVKNSTEGVPDMRGVSSTGTNHEGSRRNPGMDLNEMHSEEAGKQRDEQGSVAGKKFGTNDEREQKRISDATEKE